MRLINTIRKKIWLCVNVAFAGFIVATGFALYSNHQLKNHLVHIRDLDFHLAMHSNELLNQFVVQKDFYKESFLFGLPEAAESGNGLSPQIIASIASLTETNRSRRSLPADRIDSLLTLKERYRKYSEEAAQLYPVLAQGDDPGQHIKILQDLAAIQSDIQNNLEYFAGFYRESFRNNVTVLMDMTSRNNLLLSGFFIALLAFMTLAVNWAAERTLIKPLAHIKEAVRAFGRGQRNFPALEVMDGNDDIGELGAAIITMTKDLVRTTVSKVYVESILHNMNDSLIVTSDDFRIRSVNRATLDLLGYGQDELIGRHISKVLMAFPAGEAEPGSACESNFAAHLCRNAEKAFLTRDAREIPVLLSTSRLKDGDSVAQGLVYVAKDITERKIAEHKLEQMALYDFLTGLPNRLTFHDRLRQTLKQAHRENHQAGLLFVDLDRFKEVNDTLGHASGDVLLKSVSRWLSGCVRDCDTVARLGGDEFAVILDNISQPQDAVNTATRILAAFAGTIQHEGKKIFSSPSIGIAIFPLDARNSEDLLKNADMAMYRAKQGGGNGFCLFAGASNMELSAPAGPEA
ncbi:MAG: diguanylate cyclase [Deltaproteobacteria bacterium]|nr:diguanylate cyclase [Deltaproteobacteria bacterium]